MRVKCLNNTFMKDVGPFYKKKLELYKYDKLEIGQEYEAVLQFGSLKRMLLFDFINKTHTTVNLDYFVENFEVIK